LAQVLRWDWREGVLGIRIRFKGGLRAGESLEFDDQVELVTIGRDPEKCQVALPPSEMGVGREHCSLKRVLGRYRLVVNEVNAVFFDGERAVHDQLLSQEVDIQLGKGGPELVVETVSESVLASTEGQSPAEAGRKTQAERAEASFRRSKSLIFAGLLAIAAGGWAIHEITDDVTAGETRTEDLTAKAEDLTERTGDLTERTEDLTERTEDLTQRTEDLTERTEDLTERTEDLAERTEDLEGAQRDFATSVGAKIAQLQRTSPERLRETLSTARDSVLMLVQRGEGGGEAALGTAWVVAEGRLVTNAHVVRGYEEAKEVEPHLTLVARSPQGLEFVVTAFDVHPGYDEFPRVVQNYGPLRLALLMATDETGRLADAWEQSEAVQPHIPACDVALLKVEGENLPPPLPLADVSGSPPTIGQPVGMIGYSVESFGFASTLAPTPQVRVGLVSAVTDFLVEEDPSGQLIQHSMPGSGGSSGSPVLDAEGRVIAVHSALEHAFLGGYGRIPLALAAYGQRIDLVRDLLDGAALERLQQLRKDWQEDLARYESREPTASEVLAQLTLEFQDAAFPAITRARPSQTLTLTASGSGRRSARGRVDAFEGPLLVVAFSTDRSPVRLVAPRFGRPPADPVEGQWPDVMVLPPASGALELEVIGEAGTEVELHVIEGQAPPLKRAEEMIVASWAMAYFPDLLPEAVTIEEGVTGDPLGGQRYGHSLDVTLVAGVPQLLLAMAPDRRDLDLELFDGTSMVASNLEPDWHPAIGTGPLPNDIPLRLQVVGFTEDQAFAVRHVRLLPAQPGRALQYLLDQWAWQQGLQPDLVEELSGRLEEPPPDGLPLAESRQSLELEGPGRYLIVCQPVGDQVDLDLLVSTPAGRLYAEDQRYSNWAWGTVVLEQPQRVEVLTMGQEAAAYRLSVYRGR
jgi:S1-C subfamily serine protease